MEINTSKPVNKKLLFVSGLQLFPAESGGQLRSSNICTSLSEIGNDVLVYSFTGRKANYLQCAQSSKNKISKHLTEYVDMTKLFGLMQFISYRLRLPPLWLNLLLKIHTPKALKSYIENADIIILDFPYLYPLAKQIKDKKLILNTHNAEFKLIRPTGIFSKLLSKLVRLIETNAFNLINTVLFCSSHDQSTFKELDAQPHDSHILSNGIDINLFNKNDLQRHEYRKILGIQDHTNLILFTGSQFGPNVEGLTLLKEYISENQNFLFDNQIKFLVVGTVSDKFHHSDFLITTSRVKDIHPYFQASDFAINPVISGSGTNVKMMEYIAAKLPIFTTKTGKRGLKLKDEESCFVFTFENLSKIISKVLNPDQYIDLNLISNNAYNDNLSIIDMKTAISELDLFQDNKKEPHVNNS